MPPPPPHPPAQTPSPGYLPGRDRGMVDRLIWVWDGSKLEVTQGKDHGAEPNWEGPEIESRYRGWFDPTRNEMFVVSPRRRPGDTTPASRGVPGVLDRVLRRRFNEGFTYLVF